MYGAIGQDIYFAIQGFLKLQLKAYKIKQRFVFSILEFHQNIDATILRLLASNEGAE